MMHKVCKKAAHKNKKVAHFFAHFFWSTNPDKQRYFVLYGYFYKKEGG